MVWKFILYLYGGGPPIVRKVPNIYDGFSESKKSGKSKSVARQSTEPDPTENGNASNLQKSQDNSHTTSTTATSKDLE
jgi:hypothetical protein